MDKKRQRIAFLTSQLEGDFNEPLWENIHLEAKKQDMDLVILPGSNLIIDASQGSTYNEVFNFFNCNSFDGLIVSSGTLSNNVGIDAYISFLQKYISIPMVSLSVDIGICSSISIDNFTGMKLMAEHLVHHHNFSRFAYISGTKENPECEQRLSGFKAGLKGCGYLISDENIFYGDFNKESVEESLEALFNRGRLDIEVISCANDSMATGVIELLKQKGYMVPGDIKVTGFDNSILTKTESPSITSVNQPLDEIARESVLMLKNIIENSSEDFKHIVKETSLVIRESCGCLEFPELKKLTCGNNNGNKNINNEILHLLNIDIQTDNSPVNTDFVSVKKIRDILYKSDRGADYTRLRNEVFGIIACLKEKLTQSQYNIIELISYQLITLFKNYEVRLHLYKLAFRAQSAFGSRLTYQKLLTSKDLKSLYNTIDDIFNLNNIHSYYIILQDSSSNNGSLRLTYAKKDGEVIDCDKTPLLFYEQDFIPIKYLPEKKRTTLISQSLFSQNKYFGYLVIEVQNLDSTFYADMQMKISSALMSILTLEERLEAERVLNRSLIELKETQELLVESEKLAALGNIVAGIAHELNTPIGIIITAFSYLKENIESLNESYSNNKISKKAIDSFFQSVGSGNDLIDNNLKRTVELLDRFKLISTNYDLENRRDFLLYGHIAELISSNEKTIKSNNINVVINISENLKIHSYPGIFSQILTNLLENSIIHGLINRDNGVITISAEQIKNNLILTYKDNGKGCLIEDLADIYSPFFTTMRKTGHSGLGLTIVYNLLKHKLKGTIEAVNNSGLEFKIVIPL